MKRLRDPAESFHWKASPADPFFVADFVRASQVEPPRQGAAIQTVFPTGTPSLNVVATDEGDAPGLAGGAGLPEGFGLGVPEIS